MPRHDEHLLRQALAARGAGDAETAQRWWNELVTDNFDRIRGFVRIAGRGRLSPEELDEALALALVKLCTRMIVTFGGTSMGEWVQSTKQLVEFACLDVQRRAARISAREVSLDARLSGVSDDDPERFDRVIYERLEDMRREQEDREEEAAGLLDGQAFLDEAVPRLSPKRRAVIELDRANMPVEEMQRRLGLTPEAIYASRSRAIKDLARMRQEYGS